MKITKNILAIALFVSVILLGSCSKYEEGPAFSLKTKKARISRAWNIDKIIDGDTGQVTQGNSDDVLTFYKDGKYSYKSGIIALDGEWTFIDDNARVQTQFTVLGATTINKYKILKLTSKELWVEEDNKDKTYYKAK